MDTQISDVSLLLVSGLVLVSLVFSYRQHLQLEKDILVSSVRAVVQLLLVGEILHIVFGYQSRLFTLGLLLVMLCNAAYNAAKKGKGIRGAYLYSLLGIGMGTSATLFILLASGAIRFEAYQLIPVGGMVMSGAMIASGLCYKELVASFRLRRQEIEVKLALGGTVHQASQALLRDAVKTGMQPNLDSAKTLGIVSLPGMMTGLILGGIDPMQAVKYQIMVTFMNLSGTAIASFIVSYLSYRSFFNRRQQYKLMKE